MSRLSDASPTDLASLNWYTAKKGDTLALIAKKLNVSRTDLAEANYMSAKARVTVGQQLMVPREATALMAAKTTDGDVTATAAASPAASATVVAATRSNQSKGTPAVLDASRTVPIGDDGPRSAEAGRVKVTYSVKRGDTLASIARLFKTTVSAIQSWNPSIPGDRIAAGQRLTLYRIAG
jgi:membrane-bound lytic murein transglycosylase D